jgi:transcription-repair coupling factor (superfamily II helicase)
MSLAGLINAALADPAIQAMVSAADTDHLALSGPPALRPLAIAALAGRAERTVLAVTSTGREAEDLVDSLRCLLPPDSVAL